MSGRRGDPVTNLRDRAVQQKISKEHLLTPKIIEEDIEIESLGGTVRMRSLTHAQRREIQEKSGFGGKDFDEDKLVMLSIQYSLVEPSLTEDEVMELKNQNYSVLDELNMHVQLMNFMGKADQLKKGSETTPNSDLASSSPETSA